MGVFVGWRDTGSHEVTRALTLHHLQTIAGVL